MKYLYFLFLFFSFSFKTSADDCITVRIAIKSYYDECQSYMDLYNPGEFGMGISPKKRFSYTHQGQNFSYLECFSTQNELGQGIRYVSNPFLDNCTAGIAPLSSQNANSCGVPGSIIEVSNQVVGEVIPVVGAPFELVYYSNKVIGRTEDYISRIPITGQTYSSAVTNLELLIKNEVDSTVVSSSYYPSSNIIYNYQWNGLDASSIETWGKIRRNVTISEIATDFTFPPEPRDIYLGNLKAKKLGTGAWLPSVWHFYDEASGTLFKGDGSFREIKGKVSGAYTEVADESGSEVYYFDSTGKISHTKTGLTGATIFTFLYDGAGRITSITQAFGQVTTFSRDGSGLLQSIVAPNGKVTNVSFNTNGYLSEVSNPNSEEYLMTYYGTTGGLLHTFTKPSGDVTTLSYDSYGNLTSDTHTNGFSLTLSKVDGVVSSMSSEGVTNFSKYTPWDSTETSTSATGLVTYVSTAPTTTTISSFLGNRNYSYESDLRFGDQVKNISNSYISNYGVRNTSFIRSLNLNTPNDPFSINTYSILETVGPSETTSVYSGSNNSWVTTSKLGRTLTKSLDIYERPISMQKGNLTATNFTYTNELLTKISQTSARETSFTYFTNKLLKDVTNALNEVTSYTYDNAERLLTKTLPDLRVITYSYDSNGNITSITPPSRPVHTLTYGLNEKLVDYTPPSLSGVSIVNTEYTYDLDKRLTKITRPDGKEIDFTYNTANGLLDTTSGLFGTITHSYNLGSLTSVVDQYGSTLNMNYTGNKVTSSDLSVTAGAVYSYSRTPNATAGEKTASETISGLGASSVNRTLAYTYDDDELLTGAGTMSLVYNVPNGQLTATTLTNIKDYTYYNSFGEVIQYVVKKGTPVIYQYDLIRDNLGRVTKKTELLNAVTTIWDYLYDSAGRLTQVSKNSVIVATYSYNNNSNRTGGVIRGVSTTASYDDQDRLTTYNGVTRSYNANGELLSLGAAVLTYDVFGNLNQYVNGSTNVTYEVDPLQRRLGRKINGVATTRTRYIYNPENQVIGELNYQNKLSKTFIYATKSHVPDYYIDSSGNKFRIITDHLGSVRMVVNASTGTVSQYMEHDEFGVVLTDTNPGLTPFGFAGGLYTPQSRLVRFGARDYDPQTGRWTSKDPILFEGNDVNLYGYVFQNPVNLIDPSGEIAWLAFPAALAIIDILDSNFQTGIMTDKDVKDINKREFQNRTWYKFQLDNYLKNIEKREMKKNKNAIPNKCEAT